MEEQSIHHVQNLTSQELDDSVESEDTKVDGMESNIEPDPSYDINTLMSFCLRVGKCFDDLEQAFEFWKAYGKKVGFGVRVHYSHKNKKTQVVTSSVYVCYTEDFKEKSQDNVIVKNPRDEVRCGCKARLKIDMDKKTGKYIIKFFEATHNHELEPEDTAHMHRSNRHVDKAQAFTIDLASDSSIPPTIMHEFLSRKVGGRSNVGFILEDLKTYLKVRRHKNMIKGELGSILAYFQRQKKSDKKFYYDLHLDCEEMVTNIFWADGKMVADYDVFGDILTFDTTFGTNNESRPLAVFIGFNHHRKMVVFGAALLYDETATSFSWLFETFVNAQNTKKPRTIFTDQDAAMASTLKTTWPHVYHALCTSHIHQHALKYCCNYMKSDKPFLRDFNHLMFDMMEKAEFENHWLTFIMEYKVKENDWPSRIYKVKEKWARAYMKNVFTLGVRSTQLSECFNSHLKKLLRPNMNIPDFFNHFDRVVESKRNNEVESDHKTRQLIRSLGFHKSLLLKQASKVYTRNMFIRFKAEYKEVDLFK